MAALAWLVIARGAAAGVWVQPPGAAFIQLSSSFSGVGSRFDESGKRAPISDPRFLGPATGGVFESGRTTGVELAAYAEIGLPAGIEIFGRLPWVTVQDRWNFAVAGNDDLVSRNSGFGDASGGARIGHSFGPLAGSVFAQVEGPLYDNRLEPLNRTSADQDLTDDRPTRGEGTIDVDLGLGAGLAAARGWAQVEGAVRLRDRAYSTQLPGRAQAGGWLLPWGAVLADVEWLGSLADGDQPDTWLDTSDRAVPGIDRASLLEVGAGLRVEPLRSDGGEGNPAHTLGFSARASTTVLGRRTSAIDEISVLASWRPVLE